MSGDDKEIVLTHGDLSLYLSDLETLAKDSWLNDRIISFAIDYMFETMLNDVEKELVSVVHAPICHMIKFMDHNYMMSLCESLSWSTKEYLIFILNDHNDPSAAGGSHWSILYHRRSYQKFFLIDSIKRPSLITAKQILVMVTRCLGLPCAELIVEQCAKQENFSDCGLYAIEFVRLIFRALSDKEQCLNFTNITSQEVANRRQSWSMIIRNLINEAHRPSCSS